MTPLFQIMLNNKDSQAELQVHGVGSILQPDKKRNSDHSRAEVLSGRLILTKQTETIQYEKYGTNIRRRSEFRWS